MPSQAGCERNFSTLGWFFGDRRNRLSVSHVESMAKVRSYYLTNIKKELAYYDSIGGYNIDFNYRDAQRTAVTEDTKSILINVDGVYEITPEKVKEVLKTFLY